MIDAAYALTRRRGKTATVVVCDGVAYTFNVETGAQGGGETAYTVRWVVKDPTRYSRVLRAQACEGNIGETTFTMWLPDVRQMFTRLDGEDYVIFENVRYGVVSFEIEDRTSVIVTATQTVRT